MKFVFIDEVENSHKSKKFLGLGAVIANSNTYHKYKEKFDIEFSKLGWDKEIEFKGKYLFSKDGDSSVSIDKRIDFVKEVAKSFNADKNARLKCFFSCAYDGSSDSEYLSLLSKIVAKVKPDGSGHKAVIAYFIDNNEKVGKKKIIETVEKSKPKGVQVFERPFFVDSDNFVPGIIAVDVFCYLQSWIELNPDEKGQATLFSGITETNKRKLSTVKEIISLIKSIKDVKK